MAKKTPLYDCHVAAGGKIVDFAGYDLPVQYVGVQEEHQAVREKAGLFDVSHMGEFLLTGSDALKNLNFIASNDFTSMKDGGVRYTVLCNENGGIVDDVLVYKFDEERYMVVPNASNRQKDYDFFQKYIAGDVRLEDRSDSISQIALQGPSSKAILTKLIDESELPEKYYTFKENVNCLGVKCIISQTGYTGEFGYEIYCENEGAAKIWAALLEAGKDEGLIPAGLGARDTLRLEASMPLYGHEMSDTITPFEANLNFAVKMNKEDFVGKSALENQLEAKRSRVGIQMVGRGIAREEYKVLKDGKEIGMVTSGTFCPTLGGAYGMALMDVAYADLDTEVEIDVRGRLTVAKIVPLPLYKRG